MSTYPPFFDETKLTFEMQANLIELSHDAILVRDPASNIVSWNRGAEELYGWTAQEAIGKISHDLFQTRFPMPREELEGLLTKGEQWEGELVHTRRDGTQVIVESRQVLMRDHQGRPSAVLEINRDITERKQRERENQEQYRTIVRTANEGIWLIDKQAHTLYTNERMAVMLGYTVEEMAGRRVPEFVFPDDQPRAQEHIGRNLQGNFEQFDFRFCRKDGSPLHVLACTSPVHDGRGEIVGAVGMFTDMTEHKQAEEVRLQLAALVESSEDAIIGKTNEGIITSWNRAAERIYGYSAEEVVGRSITIIFPADRQDEFVGIMERITRGERIEHFETRRVRKGGTVIDVSVTISPIHDSEGQITGASAIAREITEQKRLEAEVRQARQQLELVFQNIADGVVVQRTDGTVVYMNDAGAKLCGYASGSEVVAAPEFQTQRASTLRRFEIKDEQGNPFPLVELPGNRALRGEPAPEGIMQYYDDVSQTRRWSRVKARPIVDEYGRVQLAVTVFSDITEAYEAELRKDEFIGMASHELKTPITTLKGLTQLLKRRLEKQGLSESVAALSTMDNQIDKLTRLVNDLLDVTKIRAGRLVYEEERLALDALVRDVVEIARQLSDTHMLTVDGVSDGYVIGDSDRLGQVFLNLISNAIKYSPQADRVDIQIGSSDGRAIVSVRDYGVGIPKEHHGKIFERFYRVYDERTRGLPGLGMGLYISQEIVKRHGGEITLESAEEVGTIFRVRLPLVKM